MECVTNHPLRRNAKIISAGAGYWRGGYLVCPQMPDGRQSAQTTKVQSESLCLARCESKLQCRRFPRPAIFLRDPAPEFVRRRRGSVVFHGEARNQEIARTGDSFRLHQRKNFSSNTLACTFRETSAEIPHQQRSETHGFRPFSG